MSAYMTGVKMNNDVIAMSTDTQALTAAGAPYINGADSTCPASGNGTPVATLLELAKAAGRGTGVVTTTRVTHATPAATYSHVCHRDGENTIVAQLAVGGTGYNTALGADGVDVVLGGGWQHFLPKGAAAGSSRSDARDLVAEMKAKGYGCGLGRPLGRRRQHRSACGRRRYAGLARHATGRRVEERLTCREGWRVVAPGALVR